MIKIKIDIKCEVSLGNMTQHYKKLGYDVTQSKTIVVSIDDLPRNSHKKERRQCDECGKIYTKTHRSHMDTYEAFGIDLCQECVKTDKYISISKEKSKNTCMERYGVEFVSQAEEFQKKVKESNINKYGVTHPMKVAEICQKVAQTNLERYGVASVLELDCIKDRIEETNIQKYGFKCSLQNPEIKEKAIKTMVEKYGVENPSFSKEIQEKRTATFLERYGCENPGQNDEIKKKIAESFNKNGTTKTSKQQIEIYNMIKKIYNRNQVEINYTQDFYNLDVVLFCGTTKIDIEYDGWYWHQDKQKDIQRDFIVKRKGYKILRIRSGEMIPKYNQLKEAVEYLINSDHTYNCLVLDDWKNEWV